MYFPIVCGAVLIILGLIDRKKMLAGLKVGFKRFTNAFTMFFVVFFALSLFLYIFSSVWISQQLSGSNAWFACIIALAAGSVFVLPGFIAFPLGGVLVGNGVPYFIVSAFTSSLMMVGILTLPIETAWLGKRFAVFRNLIALFITLCVALCTGVLHGELP